MRVFVANFRKTRSEAEIKRNSLHHDGGPRQHNHIAEGMARHDQLVENGYDLAFGFYRGEVTVQYIPETNDYSVSTTLLNPTEADIEAAKERISNDSNLDTVAQRIPRQPGGGGRRYRGPGTWRYGARPVRPRRGSQGSQV